MFFLFENVVSTEILFTLLLLITGLSSIPFEILRIFSVLFPKIFFIFSIDDVLKSLHK